MLIKILGSGCARCKRLEQLTRDALVEIGVEADVEHVTEMDKIMTYPVMGTPALVVDEVVKVAGRMPSRGELISWLQ